MIYISAVDRRQCYMARYNKKMVFTKIRKKFENECNKLVDKNISNVFQIIEIVLMYMAKLYNFEEIY